jgi:uncharacterized membrane protein (DUF485 family)
MPSMHLSASIFLLTAACIVRVRWLQYFAAAMVATTAWATLALGEHYFVDLVVAIPACATIAFVTLQPKRSASRIATISALLSLLVFVSWLSLLRWQPGALSHTVTLWSFTSIGSVAGVASIIFTIRSLRRTM